ncbi:restriction endonuclease [Microcoleus sp. N9_B4]|uniref:restriction endonuclease n=1 Tax=Microcoleus sp. N9_B4 TaxID=3055386 RepID=UPI002FD01687
MSTQNYRRTVEEIRELASMFWPSDLSQKEAELSVIPKLIETQEQFIAILSVPVSELSGLFQIVEASTLSANMFLKHLIVLADFGGEMIKRVNSQFNSMFPLKRLDYLWNLQTYSYQFTFLPASGQLTNNKLGIDGKKILQNQSLSLAHKDLIAILLFGASSLNEKSAEVLAKCEIGNYLGQPDKLNKFIKQRYIWVSRITSGSQANTLGQIAQNFVKEYLQDNLGVIDIAIRPNGHLPGVRHTDQESEKGLTTFDLVLSKEDKFVAIEISFQVTTNSVIERKAGQARARFEQIEKAGYKMAYVIDGAGNFERENAIRTLCTYSHCTVAFSHNELNVLCDFLRDYFVPNNE